MNFLLYSNLVFLFVSSVTLGISFGDKFDFVFFEFIFSVASMEVPPDPTEIAAGVAFERHHNSVVQIMGYTGRRGCQPRKNFLAAGLSLGKRRKSHEHA